MHTCTDYTRYLQLSSRSHPSLPSLASFERSRGKRNQSERGQSKMRKHALRHPIQPAIYPRREIVRSGRCAFSMTWILRHVVMTTVAVPLSIPRSSQPRKNWGFDPEPGRRCSTFLSNLAETTALPFSTRPLPLLLRFPPHLSFRRQSRNCDRVRSSNVDISSRFRRVRFQSRRKSGKNRRRQIGWKINQGGRGRSE